MPSARGGVESTFLQRSRQQVWVSPKGTYPPREPPLQTNLMVPSGVATLAA